MGGGDDDCFPSSVSLDPFFPFPLSSFLPFSRGWSVISQPPIFVLLPSFPFLSFYLFCVIAPLVFAIWSLKKFTCYNLKN